jgi:hypothetical protein
VSYDTISKLCAGGSLLLALLALWCTYLYLKPCSEVPQVAGELTIGTKPATDSGPMAPTDRQRLEAYEQRKSEFALLTGVAAVVGAGLCFYSARSFGHAHWKWLQEHSRD